MSSERSEGPGSSESRRLRESARARRALNAAVNRKLQTFVDGVLQNEEETAKVKRLRYKEQRRLEEAPDIISTNDEEAEDHEQRVDECRSETTGEGSESDDYSEDEEDEEELEESLVEIFARLVKDQESDGQVVDTDTMYATDGEEFMVAVRRRDRLQSVRRFGTAEADEISVLLECVGDRVEEGSECGALEGGVDGDAQGTVL